MKKILKYGDLIKFPFPKPDRTCQIGELVLSSYSGDSPLALVDCSIEIDHRFPHDAAALKYGLYIGTFKVTIRPVSEEDREIYGYERTYFSDIRNTILKLNPEYELAPYPQELLVEDPDENFDQEITRSDFEGLSGHESMLSRF